MQQHGLDPTAPRKTRSHHNTQLCWYRSHLFPTPFKGLWIFRSIMVASVGKHLAPRLFLNLTRRPLLQRNHPTHGDATHGAQPRVCGGPLFFPHIIDNILDHVHSNSVGTYLALRGVSHAWEDSIKTRLFWHLCIHTYDPGSYRLPLSRVPYT
jgi:hypothetical protein